MRVKNFCEIFAIVTCTSCSYFAVTGILIELSQSTADSIDFSSDEVQYGLCIFAWFFIWLTVAVILHMLCKCVLVLNSSWQ